MEVYLKAGRLAPNDPEPHYNRGILLANIGRIDEAIAAFDDALSRDNTFRQAYFNRGVLQLRRGAERPAREDFRRFVDLGGDLPAQLRTLLADPTPSPTP
jgi:Flp pilus assembly protein TadD